MEKAVLQKFIDAIETSDADDYCIRFNGGNKIAYHGSDSCRFELTEDAVITLESNPNYPKANTHPYIIAMVPYDNIDSAFAPNLTVKDAITILDSLGALTEEMKSFIKSYGSVSDLIIKKHGSNAGLDVMVDKDGKPQVGMYSPGYVTKGDI